MKILQHFSEISNFKFGGKGNNLAKLFQEGFNVPVGYVVSEEIIKDLLGNSYPKSKEELLLIMDERSNDLLELSERIWMELQGNIEASNCSYAVRSSANMEDSSKLSFAGQFESVLNVCSANELSIALKECYVSKFNDTVLNYCSQNNILHEDLKLNIVIQEFIEADYSGVCFSVNPLTGDYKELVVEVVKGRGDILVKGEVTPDKYIINWFDKQVVLDIDEQSTGISDDEMLRFADEFLKIQQYYGEPQDIEWVVKDNVLKIVQSRPLTSINFKTENSWTNADLKDGGISSEITTPLMYSLYEYIFETTLGNYLASVNLHPNYKPKKWFTHYMYYSYWNLSATKDGVKKIPGFVERDFDNDLGVEITYEGKGHVTKISFRSIIDGIKILTSLNKSINRTISGSSDELKRIDNILIKNKVDYSQLSIEDFQIHLSKLVKDDYLSIEGSYFWVIYNNSNYSTLFKDLFDKKAKKYKIQYLKLIGGLDDVSHLRPIKELSVLVSKTINNKDAVNYFAGNSVIDIVETFKRKQLPHLQEEFDAFFLQFGYHSMKELDIKYPNWSEDPTQPFSTFISMLRQHGDTFNDSLNRQKDLYQSEFNKIGSKKLRKAIEKHRKLLWLREEYRDRSAQMYHTLRLCFLEAGNRLMELKVIEKQDDIFFLTYDDILRAFRADLINVMEKVYNNRVAYRSFRNFNRPNEILVNASRPSDYIIKDGDLNSMNGIACSSGMIKAQVYIANTIEDAEKMPHGVIMVTKFTDPAWTVYFSKISGLVTETGGMLSHGAIISREYGIPAVLGVKDATNKLKTGSEILLDGDNGMILISPN